MKKMLKSKKGISPILATLLLIVIAVAAVIVTYAWVMTFTSSQTQQAGVFLKKDAGCLWKTGNVTVYVRNTGTSDAEIDIVYINEAPQTTVTFDPSSKIVAKDGGLITIMITFSWTPNTEYRFQISPKVGERLSFTESSPSA
jgi:flagellin-like protein